MTPDPDKQIDHIPDETRPTLRIWWAAWALVAFFWTVHFVSGAESQWHQIILGFNTGMILALWACDITGGKVPSSWRRKPSRRSRPL